MHLKSQKNLRGNHKPHVSKTLRLSIIKCLKNKASDKQNYTKQRNLVPKLNKQIKKEYFDNIEDNTDSKNFWNKCKPYFSDKFNAGDYKILLIENKEIINESAKVANMFNSYFESVTESLHLFHWAPETYDQAKDSVERIIERFSYHPSIIKIKQNIKIKKNKILSHQYQLKLRRKLYMDYLKTNR